MRRDSLSAAALVAGLALGPALILAAFGTTMFMPSMMVHFWGVGVTAFVAAVVAAALTAVGVRLRDARTVVVASAFAAMAALLAVHGFTTPTVLVGMTGVVGLAGGMTLPVGAVLMGLSALPGFATWNGRVRMLVAFQAMLAGVIVAVAVAGVLDPALVPAVPRPHSGPALALFAVGLTIFGLLALRAGRTFLLTRRVTDLAVVVALVLLASSLPGALLMTAMDFGWWLGHALEVLGMAVLGAALLHDLRRSRRSRALVGDLRAGELVAAEEAFLGIRVRALTVRLAEKDVSTEEHTRRVAALAVGIGERLGLPPSRLRELAIGGLLHDVGKLGVSDAILKKPGRLTDEEFAAIREHPEAGYRLLGELGGFSDRVRRLVRDHHERLDGLGYPQGLRGEALDLETRILAVADVYDALVSDRVYRSAWTPGRALALLREESETAFDPACVAALADLVDGGRRDEGLALAA